MRSSNASDCASDPNWRFWHHQQLATYNLLWKCCGYSISFFFLFVEAQTKSHISVHQPPVPFPIVHLTKSEKLSLLLHDCIVYELEACSRMPIHGREYYRCKMNSFEKCIQKPLYLNEPIYHLVKSCLKKMWKEQKKYSLWPIELHEKLLRAAYREEYLEMVLSLSLYIYMHICMKKYDFILFF